MGKTRNDEADSTKASKRAGDTPDDQKPAKRTRTSRACDQCRAQREKCDGSQPVCQTCTSQSRECTYNEAPKKRGIQPNYIRSLELLLAWTLENSPDVHKTLCQSLPTAGTHVHSILAARDAEEIDHLHQAWRSSLVSRQIDQVLSGKRVECLDGGSPALQTAAWGGASQTGDRPEMLYLPANAWTMLEFYFAYVHSWMPMTEKATMMKLIYTYPPGGVEMQQATQAEHAELWSILAVSSHLMQSSVDHDQSESRRVRRVAEDLVPKGKTYEVPHLKALILLTLIDMSEGRTLDAWLRVGTVVRILSLFKLLEELEGTTRWCRHVHLAAFLTESALAMRMNAKGHLTPEYIESVGFVNEDGRDEWEPWQDPLISNVKTSRAPARAFSTLNRLVVTHVQLVRAGNALAEAASEASYSNIVFDLLENAARKEGRVQPTVLLDRPQELVPQVLPNAQTSPSWAAPSQPVASQMTTQGFDHLNVPNDFSDMDPATIAPTALDGNTGVEDGDIFQELAMLERTDSSNHFMQNLGFGPDLDLQEFFGDIYQSSDPSLAPPQPLHQLGGYPNT